MANRIVSIFERSLTTSVNNIEHIESQSLNGVSVVKVFLQLNANVDGAISEIIAEAQTGIKQFPPGITPPLVLSYNAATLPILQLGLGGKGLSEQELNDLGNNQIRPQLATAPPSPGLILTIQPRKCGTGTSQLCAWRSATYFVGLLEFRRVKIVKDIEAEVKGDTPEDKSLRYGLHFDKMELFYLAVFELARIEDLVVRLVLEFFGDDLMAVDRTDKRWEKKLDWDKMKDALNKRGHPDKNPHPRLEAMQDDTYEAMMTLVRSYRSKGEVMTLKDFRDKRTHRVTPSVDYPELGAVISEAKTFSDHIVIPYGAARKKPEYEFLKLYEDSKVAYKHLLAMLSGLSKILCA